MCRMLMLFEKSNSIVLCHVSITINRFYRTFDNPIKNIPGFLKVTYHNYASLIVNKGAAG